MILLFIGLVALVGIVLLLVVLWRLIGKRKYPRIAFVSSLVLAVTWLGLSLGLVPGSTTYLMYGYSRDLLGRGFLFSGDPRFAYDSPRAFNGDGYSIEVRDLPESLSHWLAQPPPSLFIRFPTKPASRDEWSGVHWRSTPIPESERKYLDFAVAGPLDGEQAIAAMHLLAQLASKPGSYYAYLYKEELDGHVLNVDFFLISPEDGSLIIVNNNT